MHMTNTRLTDPEILERRYPVKLLKFQLAKNTGGRGLFNGGDGIDRHMKFRLVQNSVFAVQYDAQYSNTLLSTLEYKIINNASKFS